MSSAIGGLRRAEHERGPRRAVDDVRVDRARPAVGIGHPAGSPPSAAAPGPIQRVGIDEMRLDVDHRRAAAERRRRPRRARAARRLGHVVEAAAVGLVDRAQRRRGAAPVERVRGCRAGRARGRGVDQRSPAARERDCVAPTPRAAARTRRSTVARSSGGTTAVMTADRTRARLLRAEQHRGLRARGLAAGYRGDEVGEHERADADDQRS